MGPRIKTGLVARSVRPDQRAFFRKKTAAHGGVNRPEAVGARRQVVSRTSYAALGGCFFGTVIFGSNFAAFFSPVIRGSR